MVVYIDCFAAQTWSFFKEDTWQIIAVKWKKLSYI